MAKLKTHKATVKRIRATKSGKLLRDKAAKSHLLTHKSDRKKVPLMLSKSDIKKVKKLAPYL
jgi:large subunit ribosomal protein L35